MLELTLENFELALPSNKKTDEPLCFYNGIVNMQHTFIMPVQNSLDPIFIFSSIQPDGYLKSKQAIQIKCTELPIRGIPTSIKRTENWDKRLKLYLKYSYAFVLRRNSKSYEQKQKLDKVLSYFKNKINN